MMLTEDMKIEARLAEALARARGFSLANASEQMRRTCHDFVKPLVPTVRQYATELGSAKREEMRQDYEDRLGKIVREIPEDIRQDMPYLRSGNAGAQ